MTTWTKITPGTAIPFPAWLYKQDTGQMHLWRTQREMIECEPLHQLYTHYLPQERAPLPEPPKELTQREKDQEVYWRWINSRIEYTTTAETWHAALAYRDAQNAADMSQVDWCTDHDRVQCLLPKAAFNNLRARCGLEGGK